MTFQNLTIKRDKFLRLLTLNFVLFGRKTEAQAVDLNKNPLQTFETKSGIQIIEFLSGKGNLPSWGSFIKVKYTNYISDGEGIKKIDSTFERNGLFTYQHGIGEVNLAFEEIIHSMKTGGKRRAIVKINSDTEFLNLGPISASSGTREQLKFFVKNNINSKSLFLIYDVELVEILDRVDL